MARSRPSSHHPDLAPWILRARKLGAEDARVVRPRDVTCADWVRMKCEYGCDGFDSCHTCPPRAPTPKGRRSPWHHP